MKKLIFLSLLGMWASIGTSFARGHEDTFPKIRAIASEDAGSPKEESEPQSTVQEETKQNTKESLINWQMIRDPSGRR